MGDITNDETDDNHDQNAEKQPAEWRPYDAEQFSKGLKEIADLFKSDPSRLTGADNESANNK